jgi:general secretion pathway protein G
MLHWFYRHLSFSRYKKEGFNKGLTLIELLLTVAILGILSAIAVPLYTGHIGKQRNTTAITDIVNIESQIERFSSLNGRPPNNFAEAGIAPPLDPWGNAYQYLRIAGVSPTPPGIRKDHSLVPLNNDYDLYSMGADGASTPPLTGGSSWDDIIRANNGSFLDLASKY